MQTTFYTLMQASSESFLHNLVMQIAQGTSELKAQPERRVDAGISVAGTPAAAAAGGLRDDEHVQRLDVPMHPLREEQSEIPSSYGEDGMYSLLAALLLCACAPWLDAHLSPWLLCVVRACVAWCCALFGQRGSVEGGIGGVRS